MLDKSGKRVSCVRGDYENKAQMLLNPTIPFFIDTWGLLLIEGRYALRSAKVYMCLEQNVVFIYQLRPETCRYIQKLLLSIKALYPVAFTLMDKLSDLINAE